MREIVYAFIDAQNLNLGITKDILSKSKIIYSGWKLDYLKLRVYLAHKYGVSKAYIFIGYLESNNKLYKYLERCGYILIYKNTISYFSQNHNTIKGNVDAELVLFSSAILINQYDKAVIISGDGDFDCLYKFLMVRNKLLGIVVPNKIRYSSLLRKYSTFIEFLSTKRNKLESKRA